MEGFELEKFPTGLSDLVPSVYYVVVANLIYYDRTQGFLTARFLRLDTGRRLFESSSPPTPTLITILSPLSGGRTRQPFRERTISHAKDDGRLGRNHLLGHDDDQINATLAAAGHNRRL